MPVLSDRWIRRMAQERGMIEPFVEAQKRDGVISYGLSSYGYDARIADEFKIFTNIDSAVIDPKAFAPSSFVDRKTDVCIIPPNSFALGQNHQMGPLWILAGTRHRDIPPGASFHSSIKVRREQDRNYPRQRPTLPEDEVWADPRWTDPSA